jgi:hypothetical protein
MKDKAKQKVKPIELMYFLFQAEWYTIIVRTMVSIWLWSLSFFLFEVHHLYFSDLQFLDDKLVWWWRKRTVRPELKLVINPLTFGEIVCFLMDSILWSYQTQL